MLVFECRHVVAAALVAAMIAAAPASGADPQRRDVVGGLEFEEEVEVTVVSLDVFVRDADGRPVTDLEADDFVVIHDGQRHDITHFAAFTEEGLVPAPDRPDEPQSAVTGGPASSEGPPPPEKARAVRPLERDLMSVVIFVDNEHLRPIERTRVLREVDRFLSELMRPPVRVMVVGYERSLKVEQPFTSDRKAVSRAIRRLDRRHTGLGEYDTRRKKLLRDLRKLQDTGTTRALNDTMGQADILSRIRSYAESAADELDYTIGALREILTMLSGLPGRKALIHVSSGLEMVPGRDLLEGYANVYSSRAKASVLPMLTRFNRRTSWNAVASAANAQGVSFYTTDARGLGSGAISAEYAQPIDPMVTATYDMNRQETLQLLADKTGGRAILNANEVTPGLERMKEDLFVYYSIGYPVGTGGGDTVHRVDVRLPDHPEHEVRHRHNVIEKSLTSKVQDAVVSALILGMENDNRMGLEVRLDGGAPASEGRWLVPVRTTVPVDSIALLPHGDVYTGEVVLFVGVRDERGRQSDLKRREFPIELTPDQYETMSGERFTFELDLLMNAGACRVAVALLDRMTRQVSYVTREHRLAETE